LYSGRSPISTIWQARLAGAIWSHFARNAIPFLNFGGGFEQAGVDEGKDLEPTGAQPGMEHSQ